MEIVGSLVAKSLVVPLADSARYRLLETVRLFSLDQLSSEDRVADTRDRHLGWVRSFCAHGVIVAVPYADRVALGARQLSERAAYFEALDWVDVRGDQDELAGLLYGAWPVFGVERPQRGLDLIAKVERPSPDEPDRLLAHLGCEAASLIGLGDYQQAVACTTACLELARAIKAEGKMPPVGAAATVRIHGYLLTFAGEVEEARETLALLAEGAAVDPQGEAAISHDIVASELDLAVGELNLAAGALGRIHANITRCPPHVVGKVWFLTAGVALARGRFDEALTAAGHAARHPNIGPIRSQIPEVTGLTQIGLGRVREAVATFQADHGPQFDRYRLDQRNGRMAGLAALYVSLGIRSRRTSGPGRSRPCAIRPIRGTPSTGPHGSTPSVSEPARLLSRPGPLPTVAIPPPSTFASSGRWTSFTRCSERQR